MQGDELKARRKALGLSQKELADAIGMSRKSVGEMERGDAPIEQRTAMATRLLYDRYDVQRVEAGEHAGWYMVVRRTLQNTGRPDAIASLHGSTVLYGLFRRRDHAYRWINALRSTNLQPRFSRDVRRLRKADGTLRTK